MYGNSDFRNRLPTPILYQIINEYFFSTDVLRLKYKIEDKNIDVPLLRTGIAWPSDKEIKFKNPEGNLRKGIFSYSLKIDLVVKYIRWGFNYFSIYFLAFENYAKPRDWRKNVWELDLEDPNNNGFQNEDFIVWMRTAALPNFRKLYRRLNRTAFFNEGLKKGDYELHVEYSE